MEKEIDILNLSFLIVLWLTKYKHIPSKPLFSHFNLKTKTARVVKNQTATVVASIQDEVQYGCCIGQHIVWVDLRHS